MGHTALTHLSTHKSQYGSCAFCDQGFVALSKTVAQRNDLLAAAKMLCQWATVDSEGDALVRSGDVLALHAAIVKAEEEKQ